MRIKAVGFDPVASHKGWYTTPGVSDEGQDLEDAALKLQVEALAKGFYCVCGSLGGEGYRLYLIPATGIRRVIEGFEVGSHADCDANSVFEEIAFADSTNLLIPYFADPAGLKAKFSKPITQELIAVLEETLMSAEPMIDEDEGSIEPYIRKNEGIYLWWD
ncbi:MAG TPA: hypothetical protein PLN52_01600 [Opitutaceae bacterium]|nr:hypothetical protein [Opitutaceae bacterium]